VEGRSCSSGGEKDPENVPPDKKGLVQKVVQKGWGTKKRGGYCRRERGGKGCNHLKMRKRVHVPGNKGASIPEKSGGGGESKVINWRERGKGSFLGRGRTEQTGGRKKVLRPGGGNGGQSIVARGKKITAWGCSKISRRVGGKKALYGGGAGTPRPFWEMAKPGGVVVGGF